jgi:hypothetical protein
MRYPPPKNDYLLVLINDDAADTFCSVYEKGGGLLASLVLGVNERYVSKSDEAQNVAQVGLLKIESFPRCTLFIRAPAVSDDDNFLSREKALWTRLPICFQTMQIVSVVHARLEATAPWGLKRDASVAEGVGKGKHSA